MERKLRRLVGLPGARLAPQQRARFEAHLTEILHALGLARETEDTRGTPARLLDAWLEATSGYAPDPKLLTTFPAEDPLGVDSQVVEGPIPFHALCEHHALPFFGHAWVGYVAGGRLIGLSKLTRFVRQYAQRFTMQERIGQEVAQALKEALDARGTAVRIEAVHLCTRMRGVRECEAATRTATWRGTYQASESLRREFLELCRVGG